MIEFLKTDYLRYIFIFFIFALILTIISLIQEIKLLNRKKINYTNFARLKKYYDLKVNYLYIIGYGIFLIGTTFIALKIVKDSTYSIYALVFLVLNIIVFPCIYLHIARIKLNKDLSIYSLYYQIIRINYKNKEKLVKQIEELKKTYKILENENIELNKKLASYFSDFTNIDNLDTTLRPIEDLIKIHQDELNSFDNSYPNKFDKSLKAYLKTGIHYKLDIEDFNFNINYSLEKIIEAIKKNQTIIIYNFSLKNLIDEKVNSPLNLAKLIELLKELNVVLDNKFIIEVLNYLNKNQKNKDLVLKVLKKNNLITVEVLTEYVNVKDWDWVYKLSLKNLVKKNDVVKVFSSMIRNNSYNCAKKVLISSGNEFSSNIKKVLLKEKKENTTRKLFELFNKIHSSAIFFNIESVKYENLAIVLNNFFNEYFPKDTDSPEIKNIISNELFDVNGEKIEAIYNRIQKSYKNIFTSTLNTLILYTKSKCSNLDYLSYEKIITQYAHYRKNLFIKELLILDNLLIAMMLLNDDDENIISDVYKLLKQKHDINYRIKNLNLNFSNRFIVGKSIIKDIRKNNLNILRTIVYQIENQRLTLNKLMNI